MPVVFVESIVGNIYTMRMPWESVIAKGLDLVDQFVVDKDKNAQLKLEFQKLMLSEKTIPWVDATVKLFYALPHVILPVLRPFGAAAMSAFGAYCHIKGIDIDTASVVIYDSAFPAWGASRHINKMNEMRSK